MKELQPRTDAATTPSYDGTASAGLGRFGRSALTVAWCSFLAASVATMVFFAFVDPSPLASLFVPTALLPSRTALYSVGFFFFWIVCAASAGLTAWMLATHPDEPS